MYTIRHRFLLLLFFKQFRHVESPRPNRRCLSCSHGLSAPNSTDIVSPRAQAPKSVYTFVDLSTKFFVSFGCLPFVSCGMSGPALYWLRSSPLVDLVWGLSNTSTTFLPHHFITTLACRVPATLSTVPTTLVFCRFHLLSTSCFHVLLRILGSGGGLSTL